MAELVIERLGHLGDGIAGDALLPLTLPGERVDPGPPLRVLAANPERVRPVCAHFGRCGGCALQHASDAFIASWKEEVVRRALAARGLAAEFGPAHVSPPGSRRRAVFAGRRTKKTVEIGFHRRRSDTIEAIAECPVIRPGMLDLFPALGSLTRAGASRKGQLRLGVTETLTGWDVDVGGGKPLDAGLRAALADIANAHDLARLCWSGEVVAQLRPPLLRFGRAEVVPPPGAFLQATAGGEAALVGAVRAAVGDARRVADLFAGCGTFALPMAAGAEVWALEGDKAMVAAMDTGWRGAAGLKTVKAEARDLFRRPVLAGELAGVEAVVIDPPRAGAAAQTAELAGSEVPVIAALSCNPVSFARDAAALVAAGYTLDWVRVIDQFRWSTHVELAARFSRTDAPRDR